MPVRVVRRVGDSPAMEPEALAQAIQELSAWAQRNAPSPEPELRRRLREHLGADPAELEVVAEAVSPYDHVNVQVALDVYVAEPQVSCEMLGLSLEHGFRPGLAELAQRAGVYEGALDPGPVEYLGIDVGGRTVLCVKGGIALLRDGPEALAVLIAPAGQAGTDDDDAGSRLEVMARSRTVAERWLSRIRELMDEHNVYRGKVVVFGSSHPFRPAPLTVRALPDVPRDRIVLPAGTLERIERHTVGLSRHRDTLRAQGRHIKRGLLLHGPPGTGKTLTIMYLARLMADRTVVLLTGMSLGAVGAGVALARSLQPAMVVMEDVDLVAMERIHLDSNPILFELLNAMDGLDEDADLIFALTTNRPELLEPALASRPGRVDLAVELPLPDAEARRALLELYGQGLRLDVADWRPVVAATDGTSPAFTRELMRRAALVAAEAGDAATTTEHLLAAVDELRHQGGRLTATLLGTEHAPFAEGDLDQAETVDDANIA